MRQLRDDPIVAVAASLLFVLLGGVVMWLAVPQFGSPVSALVISLIIAWAILALLLCVLLLLGLRAWPVAAIAGAVWLGWFIVYAAREPGLGPLALLLLGIVVPALATVAVSLFVSARHLFPPSPGRMGPQALRALVSFAMGTNQSYYEVLRRGDEEDELVERAAGRVLSRGSGVPRAGIASGPGLVLTGCDHAVVVSDGLRLKGVEGPGIVFTGFGDRPTQTIDLRPHYRDFVVGAATQDGIRVEAGVYVAFEIDGGGQRPTFSRPFPVRKRAVFEAIRAQGLQHLPDEVRERRWYDLAEVGARRALQDLVACIPFDELYQLRGRSEPAGHRHARLAGQPGPRVAGDVSEHGVDPRARLLDDLAARLAADLANSGIRVVQVGLTNLYPVDDETALGQRIESWQAAWAQRTMLRQAEGEAERLRLVAEARARAQETLILALGKRLAELSEPGSAVSAQDVAQWFLEALREMAYRPSVLPLLPQETMDMMTRVLRRLEEGREQGH